MRWSRWNLNLICGHGRMSMQCLYGMVKYVDLVPANYIRVGCSPVALPQTFTVLSLCHILLTKRVRPKST